MNEYNGTRYGDVSGDTSAGSSTEGKSSEEIRAEIERTRSQMGEKIDTIQDRLSPDNLKQQAQTMVQDIVQESTDALIEFARTSSKQAGRSLLETIKANPLPSAVIGVGLGWLAMNMMKSQGDSDRDRYDERYGGRYRESYGYQGTYGSMYDDRGQMGQMEYGASYGAGMGAGRGMSQGSMRGARTYGGAVEDTYSGEYGYEEEWHNHPEVHPDTMFQRADSDQESSGLTEKIGKVGDAAKSAAGRVGETAQNIAGTVAGAAQSAAGAVAGAAGKVGDAAQGAAGKVAGTAQGAAHEAGHMASRVGEGAGSMAGSAMQMGQQARRQAMQTGRMAAGQAGSLASQGQYQAGRMGRTMQRSLEDNPMAFGAAALLAGVAIGLALPATRQERQLLGDVRDQVMDKAQSFATSVAEEAKQVVEEVQPRLQQTAQRVVDDLKLSGMQVTEELKQTGKEAGEELKQTLKDAGTTVKSKIGGSGEGSDSAQDTEIVSGLIVEEDEAQPEPNVGGGYDSKFDNKS